MKSFLKMLTLMACGLGLVLVGCNDDDNAQPQGTMTANVDGSPWTATEVGAVMQGGLTNITGKATDGTIITLTLDGQTEGTYPLLQNSLSAGVFSDQVNPSWVSNQGNDVTAIVTVTDINTSDSTISGEFKFIAYRLVDNTQKVITEGKFSNITFTTTISTTGDSFLKAKVDGTLFQASATFASLNFGILQVSGSSSNGEKSIGLVLDPDITVGEHDLEGIGSTNAAQYNPNSSTFLGSDSGKINITLHNKTTKVIEGTFHFEASELGGGASASITEGEFKAKY